MGYDEFDRALIDAWERAHHRYKDDPAQLDRVLRRFGGPTYTRPLRSWSLVLRANDKRIADDHVQGVVALDAGRVRAWCSPVRIDFPGVSLDEAARRFGVNRTTVSRWASPESKTWWQDVHSQMHAAGDDVRFGKPGVYRVEGRRLMLEHEHNRANTKRSTTRVWTPGYDGLDPAGEVWSGHWGRLRIGLADRVPVDFCQQLERVDRVLGAYTTRVMQWVCPVRDGGCGRWVYKLYLPMPNWTLISALGGGAGGEARSVRRFLCLRCAGLIYESAECSSSPGRRVDGVRRRVNPWDRFIKRLSAGTLAGGDVSELGCCPRS